MGREIGSWSSSNLKSARNIMREFHNQWFISSLHFTFYKLFYTSKYKYYKHFRFCYLPRENTR
jgi:hypothetical protein